MKIILTFIFLFCGLAHGARLKVIGPCSADPLFETETSLQPGTTLGDWTIDLLIKNQIPHKGDRSGIQSILNSPVGDDSFEILSDTQMRAYGWCVSVNNEQPGLMPDQVILNDPQSEVVWFYAYSLYNRGDWKDMCTPSHQVKSSFICPEK
ncbi:MAG: hypothetical protein ACXWC9_07975 [Pseudobdellovibrionaceae bacterium]